MGRLADRQVRGLAEWEDDDSEFVNGVMLHAGTNQQPVIGDDISLKISNVKLTSMTFAIESGSQFN